MLARYAASLERSNLHANSPFADVQQIQIDVSDAQRERLSSVFAAAGFESESSAGVWTIHAPQFRLLLRRSEQPGGLSAIRLALRDSIEREPLQLGRASISFDGKFATIALRR